VYALFQSHWSSRKQLGVLRCTPGQEREPIARCVAIVERVYGKRPVGWHTKSSASVNTRRLVVDAGFLYDSDAYNDDAPYYVAVNGKAHLVLPYAFDTNDMRFFNAAPFVSGRDFADYCIEAFERLWTEGEHAPKMLSIGLHTRIIGRPARIGGLVSLLRHMQHKGKVWFARREDIARHWLEKLPPPRLAPL
jgi:allantoinase